MPVPARVLLLLAALGIVPCARAADAAADAARALGTAGATLARDGDAVVEVRFPSGAVAPALLERLAELPALRSLVLAGSDVGDAGLAAVGRITTLRQLDLRDCPVTNAGLAQLAGLRQLAALRLSGKSGATTVDDAGMPHVAKLTSLRTLMLDFLWVGEQGLEALAPLEGLEELTLAQTLVRDESLATLERFPRLRRLRLARTGVTGTGLAALAGLPALVDLDLSECAQLDDGALEPIGRLVRLVRLNLWRVPVGDAGVSQLAPLVDLEWLNLDNTRVGDDGLAALAGMRTLTFLHLGSTAVTNAGLERLAGLATLRELNLTRTAVDAAGAAALNRRLPETRITLAPPAADDAVRPAPATPAGAAAPGGAIDYAPLSLFPERWKELGIDGRMHPWPGREVVLLTPNGDLDGATMGVFLARLDAGWRHYADMVGVAPRPRHLVGGLPTIAAVPDGRLTCGIGCGMIGATGIEVGGFAGGDYPLVRKRPAAFPHYYFYEMGRNWYVFGDRHSSFITGFAVFMRYSCMDAAGCTDPEARLRTAIERAEEAYAAGTMPFLEAFTMQGGRGEKQPRLEGYGGPSDQPVLYASAMLRLRRDHGGDDWTRRFFRALARCPAVPADTPAGALAQSRAWLVAASLAARCDLGPVFCDRWRLPLSPGARERLAGTDWQAADLDAAALLAALPTD